MTGLHLPNAVRDTSCLFPWCKSPRLDEAIHRRLQVRTLVDDATPEVTHPTPSTRYEYRRHLCSCNGNGCTTQTVINEKTVCLAIHHLIDTRDRHDLFNLASIKGLLMSNLEYWKTRGLVIRRYQHIQQDSIHSYI